MSVGQREHEHMHKHARTSTAVETTHQLTDKWREESSRREPPETCNLASTVCRNKEAGLLLGRN